MRFRFITRNSLCINPHRSPSLLSNKRKHVGVLFLIGEHKARLETKLATLNSHCRHRHRSCLRHSMRSGSWAYRCLGSPPGISLDRATPRNHTRLMDWNGMRPMPLHGRITRLTPRGYHHPFIHDSLLQTIGSWTASTIASEDWKSAQVKFKIHLTLMCKIRASGTYNSSNSLWTLMHC